MLKKWKNNPRFRVLSITAGAAIFFLIASVILSISFGDKKFDANKQYVVGTNIKAGRYLFRQSGTKDNNRIYFKTNIHEKSFITKQDKKFLDFFKINKNSTSVVINYNDENTEKFLEENTKINPFLQVKQFAYENKRDIQLISSYNLGVSSENLVDNIELSKGDVIYTTKSTSLLSRYAPQHLFWDNIVNSTIWVTFQAGVVVPLSMFIINYTLYLTRYGFTRYMRRNKLVQLILSSTLGVMPGDATTLVLFPFYFSKIITWGSLVALSVAGIGDSGFILMTNHFNIFGTTAKNAPNMFLMVMGIKIVIAILVGFILIKFNIDPKIPTDAEKKLLNVNNKGKRKNKKLLKQEQKEFTTEDIEEIELNMVSDEDEKLKIEHISYLEGSEVDRLLHHNKSSHALMPNKVVLWLKTHFLWVAFWVIEIAKYVVFFAQGAHVADESNNPILKLMSILTAIIVIVYWFVLSLDGNDDVAEVESSKASFKQTVIHSTESTVKILFRVIVIMSLYKVLVFGVIGNSNVEAFFGSFQTWWILTLLGVVVGFIPGCQLQIAFQTVAVSLGWPLPAVLANALSQIGDSAFSFMTVSKRAWFKLASYNALIALSVCLLIGYIMFGHF